MKKAEHQIMDSFEFWWWRRLLRVSWIVKLNQSILNKLTLNIHWRNWCWSWSSNTFYLMWRADSLEWILMLGKIESKMKRGRQRMKWLGNIIHSMEVNFEETLWDSGGQKSLACHSAWGHKELDIVNKLTYYISLVWDIQHIDWSIKYLENNLHCKSSNYQSP